MRKELWWRKSIFSKLLISFILILLPVYVLSLIMYNLGKSTLRRDISNSMISQISYYLENLEDEVRQMKTLELDLVNDRDINRLAVIPQSLSDIEKMQGILRIQQRLIAVKSSSSYISDIMVMIPAINKQIANSSISDMDQELFDRLKNESIAMTESGMSYIDDNIYINIQYPYSYMTNRKDKLFIISIELSRSQIEKTLLNMTSNADEEVFFLNRSNHDLITTNPATDVDLEIYQLLYPKMQEQAKKAEVLIVNDKRYLAVYEGSGYFDSILCKYVPENTVLRDMQKFSLWFILLTVTALGIIIIYSIYIYKFIHKPLSTLAASFKKVEKGDFGIAIEHHEDDEFGYIYRRFNAMVDNLKTLIDQVYKQKILVQKAEMKQLQSQINPHFLYNSFFILNTMTRIGDYDNLERFTQQLGTYFQFVTRSAADEVPIEKEVNHARVYTEIQAMRFSNWIRVRFDELPESFSKLVVPRLILQPIIENAFEHGLTMENEKGILHIGFENNGSEYRIVVEDNGSRTDDKTVEKMQLSLDSKADQAEVTGLQNIHQRIQLKFGPRSGLTIARSDMGGLKVTILIQDAEDGDNV